MTRPKVSIIIPVFNVEGYISDCLQSILGQSYRNYELLLINDGSTDQSGKICNNFASSDSRIQIFNQENRGVSEARNFGLKKALGDWICFVDGDDELYPNCLEGIFGSVDSLKSEVIVARSFTFKDGVVQNERYSFDDSFLIVQYDGNHLISKKSYIRGSVCGCLFSRKFLFDNDVVFPIGLKNGEDSIFMFLAYIYAKEIQFIDQIFYLVKEREGSASRKRSVNNVYRMIDNIKYIYQYIYLHPKLNSLQINILNYSIYLVVSSIFNKLYYCFSLKNYFGVFNSVRNELLTKLNIGTIKQSKTKVNLLNCSLFLFSISVLLKNFIRDLQNNGFSKSNSL
ncbi:glycosyltransferase family 2 protein [Algoriphagus litoralis]|uniref:glycosyltransferase family 2 protein n=1 Tax=Algoriphagus litoralis TaxID=2202829 RepID=UPI000DBABC2B|nr:glycosyltransferase family 2 protein [Algoriphagus litoralis]